MKEQTNSQTKPSTEQASRLLEFQVAEAYFIATGENYWTLDPVEQGKLMEAHNG